MALPFLRGGKGKGAIPVERVKDLTARGFSEVEIIDVLRKEGYSPEEIDTGLTQSLKFAAANPATPPNLGLPPEQPKERGMLPTLDDILPREQPQTVTPQLPETSLPQEYYQQDHQQAYPTEDYVDYIVQARMGDINQKITEFSVKATEIEKRVQEISDRISEIMNLRNAEQTQILSKIETFKEGVTDIETRISGLERAFKETLPALIESVRALTDLVQRFKREA